MYDVIILGGGPAGVTAALRTRELGARVALVEKSKFGGTCTNDGCVPTRVLARAARLMREASKFEQFGLIGGTPTVDFPRLQAFAKEVVEEIHTKKQIKDHLLKAGVDVYSDKGAAHFLDAHSAELEDGTVLESRRWVIAVGGHTRQVTFPGSEHTITIKDIWDQPELPKSMVVVGGAATGCQVASILASFGVKVSLLEVSPRILRLEDPLVSKVITNQFKQRGIEVISGIKGLERIEKDENGLRLFYGFQDEVREIDAETVLLSIGWVGNLEELNLADAGVQTERGYITVNDYLQTSNPNIYAVGDINGKMMLVQSGTMQGRVAAENAVLGPGARNAHKIVPHGGFTDPEYASVGITEEQARAQGIDYVAAVAPYADIDRAIIDREPEGFCKLIVSRESHRLLGAHVVGEQAVEIVQIAAAGMATDMWIEQLAELELAYPTFTAIIGLTARKIVKELGVMPMSSEWVTLGLPVEAEWEHSTPEMAAEIYDSQAELVNQFAS